MTKVVCYARVSLESQNKNDAVSIPQQLEQMRALCSRNDWEIVEEYIRFQRIIELHSSPIRE